MQKSRHHAREVALQILYQFDLNKQEAPLSEALIGHLQNYYDHFQVHPDMRVFIGKLVAGTLQEKPQLDTLLEKQAVHWKLSRMSSIDRVLLRMALYEMIYLKETPHPIIIDEAIEIGKSFGTADTPAFINGILDGVRKSLSSD